jgi:protein SCO1/2
MFSICNWFRRIIHPRPLMALAAGGALLLASSSAPANFKGDPYPKVDPPNVMPKVLGQVGIDQKLGDTLPLDTVFRDETGREVRLGSLIGPRPVILTLVYYKCPMLCTLVLNDLLRTLRPMEMDIGKDFDILTVSFDPTETSELSNAKKAQYVRELNQPGAQANWHFLTGSQDSIHKLTEAAGFRYTWDEKAKQFAHASGIIILTPQGKIARYFFGIQYAPKDVRLALVEASGNRVGSVTDQILLYCFHYDPTTGKYGFIVTRALHIGGVLTILALGVLLVMLFRHERHAPVPKADAADSYEDFSRHRD